MKRPRLVLRGLVFFHRTHLGALGTAALAAAVVVAALAVGDSVRSGLGDFAKARTGRVRFAAHAPDRLWREALASDVGGELDVPVTSALLLAGTASRPDGTARIANAQVLGVSEAFFALSPSGRSPPGFGSEDGVVVNEVAASRLGIGTGDRLVLRVEKPAATPRDSPLSSGAESTATFTAPVVGVADAREFGAFSLRVGGLPPANVYLPLSGLQAAVSEPGRANALFVGSGAEDAEAVSRALGRCFRLADAGLSLRWLGGGRGWQLESRRVILDPPAAAAARKTEGAVGVLTWLVNDIEAHGRRTPYSIVAALPPRETFLPDDLASGEIVINTWLAEDLGAGPGDEVVLTYFVLGESRRLEEESATFEVREVVPIEGPAADRDLVPVLPGLTGTEDCRDWDPGFDLELGRIREKDEAYWDEHRGTPKAFLSLAAGRELWGNRFGSLTAVRFPAKRSKPAIEEGLEARLDPGAFGLMPVDLEETAARARREGMDFGTLFLGFSGLLVAAALLLMGLVTALNVEMRREEIGTLRALGFTDGRTRRLFAAEHAVVALLGGILGAGLGLVLAAAALSALSTVWSDVAGSLALSVVVRPGT
ncbi:MAG: FtsX-like permease family protein, partial [Candidatus Latescibacteria bacterium]|nr:FtsX-like permease family protein [Candidatus Latescibacterota bacterium]